MRFLKESIILSLLFLFSSACEESIHLRPFIETQENKSDYPLFQADNQEPKIGFEFEFTSFSFKYTENKLQFLNSKEVILKDLESTFELQTDHCVDGFSDLEIVTKPFEYLETMDDLESSMRRVADLMFTVRKVDAKKTPYFHVIRRNSSSESELPHLISQYLKKDPKLTREEVLFSFDEHFRETHSIQTPMVYGDADFDGVTIFVPQQTLSMTFESLSYFFDKLAKGTNGELSKLKGANNLPRTKVRSLKKRYDSDEVMKQLAVMGLVPSDAELKGFIYLISFYLEAFMECNDDKISLKNCLPFIRPRNNFGVVFSLLSENTKAKLKAHDGMDFVELMGIILSDTETRYDMEKPLLEGNFYERKDCSSFFDKISKKLWLSQILQAKDLLTPNAYLEYFGESINSEKFKLLDDIFDAMGEKTEKINGKKSAIYEIRIHPGINLYHCSRQIFVEKFVQYAVGVAEFFKEINLLAFSSSPVKQIEN